MKKLILPIVAILLLPLIYQSTPTEILKLRVFDAFIQTPEPSGNFVILNITEEDVEREGGYPIPRKRLADINIEILDKDLRIDTYRSSGAGGQHVNTTDSAVRITHLPSKIVVQCQNERSQHKNKETCYKMLKARLYEHEMQKKEEENQKELNSKTDIGWGHQIRSYVLQPYQLVKDLRNKTENTNPASVLDGNIDQFIEEGIKIKR